jgi:hypothetical protein
VPGAILLLAGWRASTRGAFPARAGLWYLLSALGSVGLTWTTGHYGAELFYVEGMVVQAIDRDALENYKYQVFNVYRREPTSEAASDGEGRLGRRAGRPSSFGYGSQRPPLNRLTSEKRLPTGTEFPPG